MRPLHRRGIALAASAAVLASGGSALAAFQSLPLDGRVDDDAAAGIDTPNELDAGSNPDVVGGALVAGAPRVPWAIFSHGPKNLGPQVFVRAFKNGKWTTQGHGTLGGLSSGSATARSALNFDEGGVANEPTLDFAGPGRTVPWAAWSEVRADAALLPTARQIFTSRFQSATDKWQFSGANRAAAGEPPFPSLNIHTDRSAVQPALAGGPTSDPTKPGPWLTWSERGAKAPGVGVKQIYVVKPGATTAATCDASFKLGDDAGGAPIGGFCFGQTGIGRLGGDPSLNVDRTRDGVSPDIGFAGANDSVPWVVWLEKGATQTAGAGKLHDNALVFAAKGLREDTANGGVKWQVVGSSAEGLLDDSAAGGTCAAGADAEAACSLNVSPDAESGAPRVAAGTMTPGGSAVPWVVWEEASPGDAPGVHPIFVARIAPVSAGPQVGPQRFVLANDGRPVAMGTAPDITFSGHTPYVSWNRGGHAVTGHFVTPASFVRDSVPALGAKVPADMRASLSSGCTSDPFTADGSTCQGGAVGTPFVVFGDQIGERLGLRATAYRPGAPSGESASAVTSTGATLSAAIDPQGASARARFEYGTTTAYGSTTPLRTLAADGAQMLSEQLADLPAGTLIHYRAVAIDDFGTVAGADQTFTTAAAGGGVTPPPTTGNGTTTPPVLSAPTLRVTSHLRTRGANRRLSLTVGVDRASTVVATATLKGTVRGGARTLRLGRVSARYATGGRKTLRIALSTRAVRALRTWKATRVTVAVTATPASGPAAARHQTLVLKRR